MFGTLRIGPRSTEVDFIERANGKSFTEMGGVVPPHSACTRCRSRKLGCGGQKPKCTRCNADSLNCVYAPKQGSSTRRRLKRGGGRRIVRPSDPSIASLQQVQLGPEQTRPVTHPYTSTQVQAVSSSGAPISHSGSPSSASVTLNTSTTNLICVSSTTSSLDETVLSSKGSNGGNQDTNTRIVTQDLVSPTPDLSTDMLEPLFSSNSAGAPFEFLDSESTTDGVGETTSREYRGKDSSSETMHEAELGSELNAFWFMTGALGFPSDNGAAMPLSMNSHAASPSIPIDRFSLPPASIYLGNDAEAELKCTRQCTITSLLEEADNGMYNTKPESLEAALSWLKSTCKQGLVILQCHTCYINPDQMMLLLMLCDKLIMFSKKMLWHTLDESYFQDPFTIRNYEISEPGEMASVIRLLFGHQIATISKLLGGIKKSPALEGKKVQAVMIRNMEQQVAKTLVSVKDCIATSIL
ncbi:hypothetical protein F4678DRAFT_52477 [Xylaria arbuscula]|nr:hypothetical protein F4678DRAFT_52477 [Xylaria arbuscula]